MYNEKIIGQYNNGNYTVTIYEDGTKIRENDLDFLRPDFPESMDIKITDYCDMGCPFCHENSTINGKHGDIMNLEFINNLHPYTELAIGGGNPLSHPDLIPFLEKCKSLNLIPSMTVNQTHFMSNIDLIKDLVDRKLIHGLGVSVVSINKRFLEQVGNFPNAVLHVIAGIVKVEQLKKLKDKNLKILILGYKQFRRGNDLYYQMSNTIDDNIRQLCEDLPTIINDGWFKVISFDNLAIKQLNPRRVLSDQQWTQFFMGEDGFATMFIDCVKNEFARSSTSTDRYPITDNIIDMFEKIRN